VSWLHVKTVVTPTKNCWPRVLGSVQAAASDSVVIQLYAGECTPSVDQA